MKNYHCKGKIHDEEWIEGYPSDMQDSVRQSLKERYTCTDCGFSGQLNTQITYRGDNYVCWDCELKWRRGGKQVGFLSRFGQRKNREQKDV